jgi:hypothetical protein
MNTIPDTIYKVTCAEMEVLLEEVIKNADNKTEKASVLQ